MIARFDTECPICDGSIMADRDEIARDAQGRWVHAREEDCVSIIRAQAAGWVDPQPSMVAVCPLCNLQRPCWCPEAVQRPEDAADAALRRAKEDAARDPWEGF